MTNLMLCAPFLVLCTTLALANSMQAVAVMQTTPATKERAREMGLSAVIGGTPGSLDAITDVAGVEVGHTTLISGTGRLDVGEGPDSDRRDHRASRAASPRTIQCLPRGSR